MIKMYFDKFVNALLFLLTFHTLILQVIDLHSGRLENGRFSSTIFIVEFTNSILIVIGRRFADELLLGQAHIFTVQFGIHLKLPFGRHIKSERDHPIKCPQFTTVFF